MVCSRTYASDSLPSLLQKNKITSLEQYLPWVGEYIQYNYYEGPHRSVEETLAKRVGSCYDFALLNKIALKTLGYNSEIWLLWNKGEKESHAVLVFKHKGYWCYTSDDAYIPTKIISYSKFRDYVKKVFIVTELYVVPTDYVPPERYPNQ